MEDIATLIQSLGFPIFVAVWLLVRQKKSDEVIMKNTEALGAIKEVVENCHALRK